MLLLLLASLGKGWSTATADARLLRGDAGESERPNAEAKGANMFDGIASVALERKERKGGDKRKRGQRLKKKRAEERRKRMFLGVDVMGSNQNDGGVDGCRNGVKGPRAVPEQWL